MLIDIQKEELSILTEIINEVVFMHQERLNRCNKLVDKLNESIKENNPKSEYKPEKSE